jgi:16S rRNA (guanine966-N2)-methyltransferase
MRIIAGEFRSRVLVAPKGNATRPTTDRARESLFNVLNNLISFERIRVLDLYAGSGAFSFEALSRGAKHATLVERDRHAILAINANAKTLQVTDRVSVFHSDVIAFLRKQTKQFDLIFADAPYEDKQSRELLPTLLSEKATRDGLCIIEHRTGDSIVLANGSTLLRELNSGEASFTIFQKQPISIPAV